MRAHEMKVKKAFRLFTITRQSPLLHTKHFPMCVPRKGNLNEGLLLPLTRSDIIKYRSSHLLHHTVTRERPKNEIAESVSTQLQIFHTCHATVFSSGFDIAEERIFKKKAFILIHVTRVKAAMVLLVHVCADRAKCGKHWYARSISVMFYA